MLKGRFYFLKTKQKKAGFLKTVEEGHMIRGGFFFCFGFVFCFYCFLMNDNTKIAKKSR